MIQVRVEISSGGNLGESSNSPRQHNDSMTSSPSSPDDSTGNTSNNSPILPNENNNSFPLSRTCVEIRQQIVGTKTRVNCKSTETETEVTNQKRLFLSRCNSKERKCLATTDSCRRKQQLLVNSDYSVGP